MITRNITNSKGFYITDLREAKLSGNLKVKVHFIPGAKMKDFYYYLVPLLKKKPDDIILHFGTNNAPYKKEDGKYKELKSIKDFINKIKKYIYQQ